MRRSALASLVAAAGIALALGAAGRAPDGVDSEAFARAARTVLCDCGCPPQSVFDCACGHAEDLRESMAGMFRAGMSADDVVAAWVARYGEKIRVVPTTSGFNLVAWLGPGALLLGAAVGVVALLRRWRRAGAREEAREESEAPAEVNDAYAAEIERRLREESR